MRAVVSRSLPELCALAERHGVTGILLAYLERHGLLYGAGVPQLAANLQQTLAFHRRRATLFQFHCRVILSRLAAAGIEPVLLKGAALQSLIYNDPIERSYGDIDILVSRSEIEQTLKSLQAIGYSAPPEEVAARYEDLHFHYIMNKPDGAKVEIHWALERPDSPFRLDPVEFMANTILVESAALGQFPTPRPEYALLHLSVQNRENSFSRLTRLVDVDRLARTTGFDWELLVTLAGKAQARLVTHTTLRLVSELLNTPIPAGVMQSLRAPAVARWHMERLVPTRTLLQQGAQKRGVNSLLLEIWCRDSTASRLIGLMELVRGQDTALNPVDTGSGPIARFTRNVVRIAKLALYQLYLYPMSLLSHFNPFYSENTS